MSALESVIRDLETTLELESGGRAFAPGGETQLAEGAYPAPVALGAPGGARPWAYTATPADAAQEGDAAPEGDAVSPKKRGPGRPSKAPPPPKLECYGIVAAPRYPGNILEVGSGQPLAFKGLVGFFEKLKVDQIHIHGTPTGLILYTADSSESLRVRAEIHGASMNHYYCGEEFWLSVNRAHVSKIFGCINKSFHRIRWIYQNSDRGVLTIILSDTTLEKDHSFPITVAAVVPNPQWTDLARLNRERDTYKLRWTVPQSVFKKCHEIATQTAVTIRVGLVHNGQLTLSYLGTGIRDFSETYKDSSKIALRSLLAPGEIFSVHYSANAGKTLSAASPPADAVTVFCTEKKPLLFLSEDHVSGISVVTAMTPADM